MVYAIVRAGGRQEKVAVGDVLEIDRLAGRAGRHRRAARAAPRRRRDGHQRQGRRSPRSPSPPRSSAATKGPKIDILKYKNKTGYRKRQGHRQKHTQVKVTGIETGSKKK